MSAQHKPRQSDLLLAWLQERREQGVHTFELRDRYIGNPSQRRRELLDQGVRLGNRRERLNGDAIGKRWWLAEYAPDGVEIEGDPIRVEPGGQMALVEGRAA